MIYGLITLGLVIFFGAVGWLVSGLALHTLSTPIDQRLADTAATLLGSAQNVGLAIFFIAVETAFFEALPLAYTDGQSIFKRSKIVWVLLFVPVAFVFNHALLNPQSGFLDSFMVSNVRFLWIIIVLMVGVTGGLWFYFNILDDMLRAWLGIKLPAD